MINTVYKKYTHLKGDQFHSFIHSFKMATDEEMSQLMSKLKVSVPKKLSLDRPSKGGASYYSPAAIKCRQQMRLQNKNDKTKDENVEEVMLDMLAMKRNFTKTMHLRRAAIAKGKLDPNTDSGPLGLKRIGKMINWIRKTEGFTNLAEEIENLNVSKQALLQKAVLKGAAKAKGQTVDEEPLKCKL